MAEPQTDEPESEPRETRAVLDSQALRNLRAALVVMFVLGAVMIWLGYFRLDYFDYTSGDVASSHRFTAMVVIALAPGVWIWRSPRWSRVGGWFLWALAMFTWGVMRVNISRASSGMRGHTRRGRCSR